MPWPGSAILTEQHRIREPGETYSDARGHRLASFLTDRPLAARKTIFSGNANSCRSRSFRTASRRETMLCLHRLPQGRQTWLIVIRVVVIRIVITIIVIIIIILIITSILLLVILAIIVKHIIMVGFLTKAKFPFLPLARPARSGARLQLTPLPQAVRVCIYIYIYTYIYIYIHIYIYIYIHIYIYI